MCTQKIILVSVFSLLILCVCRPPASAPPLSKSSTSLYPGTIDHCAVNRTSYITLHTVANWKCAQSFTGDGRTLTKCKFYLCKYLAERGVVPDNVVVKLYAHSAEPATTFGTDGVPLGDALATSNGVAAQSLPNYDTGYQWIDFTFPSPQTVNKGSHYFLSVEYSKKGDHTHSVRVGIDTLFGGTAHNGNGADSLTRNPWVPHSQYDVLFWAIHEDSSSSSSSSK